MKGKCLQIYATLRLAEFLCGWECKTYDRRINMTRLFFFSFLRDELCVGKNFYANELAAHSMCRQQICVSNSSQGLTPLGCMRCSLNIPGHPIIATKNLRKLPSNEIEKTATSDDFISNYFPMGGRHHQNYKDLK